MRTTTTIKKGTRIRCVRMDDPRPILPGTTGTVKHVDDAEQIHVSWDNGRGLALIPDVDEFEVIGEKNGSEAE